MDGNVNSTDPVSTLYSNSAVNNAPNQYSQMVQNSPPMDSSNSDESNLNSLYVGNLDIRVNEKILFDIFSSAANVVSVKLIPDKNLSHNGLNYGFVQFSDHQSAQSALQALNGYRVFDSEIRVNWAFASSSQTREDTSNHFHIFVGDLCSEVNDQILSKAFSAFPSMSDARVMWDINSGKSRGYGFVAFREKNDADNAINAMNGEWLGKRAIRVNWANQKNPNNRPQMSSVTSYEAIVSQTSEFNTTVYVGNLTPYTTQDQVVPLFLPYGFVIEVRMQSDRGFAFIKMNSHDSAALAIASLQGHQVNGRPIKVSWGKDRPAEKTQNIYQQPGISPHYTHPYPYGIPQHYQSMIPGQQNPNANAAMPWGYGYENQPFYNPMYQQAGEGMLLGNMQHPNDLNGDKNGLLHNGY